MTVKIFWPGLSRSYRAHGSDHPCKSDPSRSSRSKYYAYWSDLPLSPIIYTEEPSLCALQIFYMRKGPVISGWSWITNTECRQLITYVSPPQLIRHYSSTPSVSSAISASCTTLDIKWRRTLLPAYHEGYTHSVLYLEYTHVEGFMKTFGRHGNSVSIACIRVIHECVSIRRIIIWVQ